MKKMDKEKIKEEFADCIIWAKHRGHYPLLDNKVNSLWAIGKKATALPSGIVSFITCGLVVDTKAIPSLSDDDLIEAYLFVITRMGTCVDQVMDSIRKNPNVDESTRSRTFTTMECWLRKLTFQYLADHADYESSLYAIGKLARLGPEKTKLLRATLEKVSVAFPAAQNDDLLNAFEEAAHFRDTTCWEDAMTWVLAKPNRPISC